MAYTLGCVVLNNHDNQEKLKEEEDFKFDVLLDLLQSSNKVDTSSLFTVAKVPTHLFSVSSCIVF